MPLADAQAHVNCGTVVFVCFVTGIAWAVCILQVAVEALKQLAAELSEQQQQQQQVLTSAQLATLDDSSS